MTRDRIQSGTSWPVDSSTKKLRTSQSQGRWGRRGRVTRRLDGKETTCSHPDTILTVRTTPWLPGGEDRVRAKPAHGLWLRWISLRWVDGYLLFLFTAVSDPVSKKRLRIGLLNLSEAGQQFSSSGEKGLIAVDIFCNRRNLN